MSEMRPFDLERGAEAGVAGDFSPGDLLLLDTCGDAGSVALLQDGKPVRELWLEPRTADTSLMRSIRGLFETLNDDQVHLAAVGVVAGPGSFTGIRVGLAVAKGLCEALALPMAAVSRLAVLASAANLEEGCAVLRAGLGQVYVWERQAGGQAVERLADLTAFVEQARGRPVVYAEETLGAVLSSIGGARYVALSAVSALPLVMEALKRGGSDLAAADANYVRDEATIYRRQLGERSLP